MLNKIISFKNIALFLLFPSVALAAPAAIVEVFPDIPLTLYVVSATSAIMGGVAGTLHRLYRLLTHLNVGDKILYRDYFVATNMASALASGFVTFWFAVYWAWPPVIIPAVTLVSGFSGSIAMEYYINKFFPSDKKDDDDNK